jgi:hypothetical protein
LQILFGSHRPTRLDLEIARERRSTPVWLHRLQRKFADQLFIRENDLSLIVLDLYQFVQVEFVTGYNSMLAAEGDDNGFFASYSQHFASGLSERLGDSDSENLPFAGLLGLLLAPS